MSPFAKSSTMELTALTAATEVIMTGDPSYIRTTLYDLMAALQDNVDPSEDTLVVAIVYHLLCEGRVTFSNSKNSQRRSLNRLH